MNRAIVLIYTSCSILAFGHAYNEQTGEPGTRVLGALLCAMGWPLYASVQIQKETP